MLFDILTLFPGMFDGVLGESILSIARQKGLIDFHFDNFRQYATDKHHTVDDYPYGGDSGMLLKPEPMTKAILEARKRCECLSPEVIFLTPQGETLTHALASELSKKQCLILVCGRYKGLDQRVRERYVDREISIGDYVLSGGEVPAMVLIESVSRLIPGVLGNEESAAVDSHYDNLLAPPQYTRPAEFEGMMVPDVLLSGHHAHIKKWQHERSLELTRKRRPDLYEKYMKNNNTDV